MEIVGYSLLHEESIAIMGYTRHSSCTHIKPTGGGTEREVERKGRKEEGREGEKKERGGEREKFSGYR